jgi:hypothetical protein
MQFMIICVFLEYPTMNKVQRPSNPEEGDDHNRTVVSPGCSLLFCDV